MHLPHIQMEILVLASILTLHLRSDKLWLFLACVTGSVSNASIQLSTYMLWVGGDENENRQRRVYLKTVACRRYAELAKSIYCESKC